MNRHPTRGRSRRRAASGPDLLVALDASSCRPLHQQIYDEVRAAIVSRRLPSGARVPSTRSLAADLGVARNTVALAYEQLRIEGYIVGRRGGGSRVAETVPDRLLAIQPPGRPSSRSPRARPGDTRKRPDMVRNQGVQLSTRGALISDVGGRLAGHARVPRRPFRLGVPALEVFPTRLWARLTARSWGTGIEGLRESDPSGEAALRAAIAEYVTNSRGARCTPEQVLVVNGAQQALDLCARLLLDPGDAVWMEEPGYQGARAAFVSAGARPVPVPVDGQGLDVTAGVGASPTARLAYVTPSHQFPLGGVMSVSRRLTLLDWARSAGAWIVEDDYDSEFRYAGRPLPCLQGLDVQTGAPGEAGRVLYIGTFNKTLAPGLRLGYLVVPAPLVEPFRAARALTDGHTPTFAQGVLADFIGEGHYARHLRRVRALYAERQHALLSAADTILEGLLTVAPDPAGLHLVGWLPADIEEEAAAVAANVEGVHVYPLSRFNGSGTISCASGIVLGYAGFEPGLLRTGVQALARALRRV